MVFGENRGWISRYTQSIKGETIENWLSMKWGVK